MGEVAWGLERASRGQQMLKLVNVECYSKWKRERKETSNSQFWKKLEGPEDTKQGIDHLRHRGDHEILR